MITELFKHAHIMYPKGNGMDLPEPAVAASLDASGLIILQQEDAQIVVHPNSVPELCKLLKKLATLAGWEA